MKRRWSLLELVALSAKRFDIHMMAILYETKLSVKSRPEGCGACAARRKITRDGRDSVVERRIKIELVEEGF